MGRCKQCGKPVTIQNVEKGPTGVFCSEVCRSQHEAFVEKVDAMEKRERVRAPGGLVAIYTKKIAGLLGAAVLLTLVIGFFAVKLGVSIPVISPAYDYLLSRIFAVIGQ